jgi:molecular chaperone GrpE
MRYPNYERPAFLFGKNDFTNEPLQCNTFRGDDGSGPSLSKKSETGGKEEKNQNENTHDDASHEPEQVKDENVDWKDRYQRLRADFDNYKKNKDKERQKLVGIGKEALLEDIFPVVEHMERAIQAVEDMKAPAGIREGIELVYCELTRALEKHGVERVKTVGEPFNPQVHEAVSVINENRFSEDTVVEEVRPGFLKGGKLLRPASVIVSKYTFSQDD